MVAFVLVVVVLAFVGFSATGRRARRAFGVPDDDWAHPTRWFSPTRLGGSVMFVGDPETEEQAHAQTALRISAGGWIGAIAVTGLLLRPDPWATFFGSAEAVAGLLAGLAVAAGFAFVQRLVADGEAKLSLLVAVLALLGAVAALGLFF